MIGMKTTDNEYNIVLGKVEEYQHDSIADHLRTALNFYWHYCDPKTGKLK